MRAFQGQPLKLLKFPKLPLCLIENHILPTLLPKSLIATQRRSLLEREEGQTKLLHSQRA